MTDLPDALAQGIDRVLEGVSPHDLYRASANLSGMYRAKDRRAGPVARTATEVLAYAATRLPATYAAVTAVLHAVRERRPAWEPDSLLDLGSGPGTALWSAASSWPSLGRLVAVEAEGPMIALGQELARTAPLASLKTATWVRARIDDPLPDGPFDLVILAYVLAELDDASQRRTLVRASQATDPDDGVTVVVEPGTPDGYARVLRAREHLLAGGATVVAPCPHDDTCPLPANDWCHFSARLSRSVAHRAAKRADLGHEDEKFSYVAVSRQPTLKAAGRIVRHPQIRPRLVQLSLCTPGGITSVAVPKSDREQFRRARKARWGDTYP